MTAQPHQLDFETTQIAMFALARSNWLDRFSRLEVAVMRCVDRFCVEPSPRGMPLSQRLTMLSALTASPTCPKDKIEKLQKLVNECIRLLPLRATIVHSEMKIGSCDGKPAALFRNGTDVAGNLPIYVIMTEHDFLADRRSLQSLTDRLSNLLVSPSGPPRPKPAAAAGP